MPTYTAVLDFPAALSLPRACPDCGGGLEPRPLGALVAFSCPECAESWRFELGRAVQVDQVPPPDVDAAESTGGAGPCASG